jgi:pyridoxine 5-phosphate synthase
LKVHAGHGLDYKTTKILKKIKQIEEFNIGHFIIGESVFHGFDKTIKTFKKIIK